MPKTTIKFKGILRLQPEKVHEGKYYGTHFYEIEHYFNEDFEELEMITFPDLPHFKRVTVFNPPRQWDKSIFNKYTITEISC